MEYEIVIGLEVHVQLKTKTKAFCGCLTDFGKEPNTQVCPVCLGLPGSLPVLNKTALDHAIKVGLALNCTVQDFTKFDRKNYFYPDLPKGYQISQYDLPLSKAGYLDIEVEDKPKRIGITRAHLEEDAGKLIHRNDVSLVDLNRTGIPLLEIVSEPDINSPLEAYEYLRRLKSILEYLEVSDCDMEKGSLRCDANISLRKKGETKLGVKTELKNLNSFKAVKDALTYEARRQQEVLENNQVVIQETRLWDTKEVKTITMRVKEEAQDYRYFPDPDLVPILIDAKKIEEIRKTIPELPKAKASRFVQDYGLLERDAEILAFFKKDALFAEECMKEYPQKDKKTVVNFLIGPLTYEANSRNCGISDLDIPGAKAELIKLITYIAEGKISNLTAKAVLSESLENGIAATKIIQDKNLFQVSDSASLDKAADEVIAANEKSVSDYKQGKTNALMFLTGQMMKKMQGKANPKAVQEILKRRLDNA